MQANSSVPTGSSAANRIVRLMGFRSRKDRFIHGYGEDRWWVVATECVESAADRKVFRRRPERRLGNLDYDLSWHVSIPTSLDGIEALSPLIHESVLTQSYLPKTAAFYHDKRI